MGTIQRLDYKEKIWKSDSKLSISDMLSFLGWILSKQTSHSGEDRLQSSDSITEDLGPQKPDPQIALLISSFFCSVVALCTLNVCIIHVFATWAETVHAERLASSTTITTVSGNFTQSLFNFTECSPYLNSSHSRPAAELVMKPKPLHLWRLLQEVGCIHTCWGLTDLEQTKPSWLPKQVRFSLQGWRKGKEVSLSLSISMCDQRLPETP